LLVAAGQAILTAFSDEIQRFPANFIADRAAEDGEGETFQHSSGCLKAAPAHAAFGSCTTAAYGK
jgi:hypothetical protein